MISQIRNSTLVRFLWGLMAIYLLNISVDAADPHPEHVGEDLSINDQESLVEFIIEKILGYENAIAEYDDHDAEEHSKKKNNRADLIFPFLIATSCIHPISVNQKTVYPPASSRLMRGHHQPDTPPPRI